MSTGEDARVAVVHVITQLELGGAQRNTLHTVTHLDAARFRASLVHGPGGVLDGELARDGIESTCCPSLQRAVSPAADLRALDELRRALKVHRARTRGPLVVHTHSSKAGVLGRMAAAGVGADAVVHTVHGFGFHAGQPRPVRAAYIAAERAMVPLTDAWVFVSRRDRAQAEELRLVGRGEGHLVRSGITLEGFGPDSAARREVRQELGIPADAPVIVTVANFKAQKNPVLGTRAFLRVAGGLPEVHWVYVGDGELRGEVEGLLAAAGVSARAHLLGWRKDVAAVLNAGDVFMLSSDHEGLPRAVLEALATGLPVAATDAGGTAEVVLPGGGRVVPVGDAGALASATLELLIHGQDVRTHAAAVLGEFDIRLMVRLQERLYTALLGMAP